MLKILIFVVVLILGFGVASFFAKRDVMFGGEKAAASGSEVVEKAEVKESSLVGGVAVIKIPTRTTIPVLATDDERFAVGDLTAEGRVVAERGGVVLVRGPHERQTLGVTRRTVPTEEIADPIGWARTEGGTIESVVLRGGICLRVGRACLSGMVEGLTEETATVRRRDGGTHYIVFGARQVADPDPMPRMQRGVK